MNSRTLIASAISAAAVAMVAVGHGALASAPGGSDSPSLTISRADDGKTFVISLGERFLVKLGEEFNWTVTVANPSVVSRVPGVLVVRGAQGIYQADRAGETDLTATGTLNCPPNQPCAQLAAVFRVRIVVSPALPYTLRLPQLARDTAVRREFVLTGTVLAGPTCPVERIPPDPRCADRPVSGAKLILLNDAGQSAGEALSDAAGRFSILLPAGRYELRPQPVQGLMGTAPPQQLLISDADIELTLHYDTGIR